MIGDGVGSKLGLVDGSSVGSIGVGEIDGLEDGFFEGFMVGRIVVGAIVGA
jgi:hypothetical protein